MCFFWYEITTVLTLRPLALFSYFTISSVHLFLKQFVVEILVYIFLVVFKQFLQKFLFKLNYTLFPNKSETVKNK